MKQISHINGYVEGTGSKVRVGSVDLSLSFDDAWALCNILDEATLKTVRHLLERDQVTRLTKLGVYVGLLIDHPSRNNDGQVTVTVEAPKEAA